MASSRGSSQKVRHEVQDCGQCSRSSLSDDVEAKNIMEILAPANACLLPIHFLAVSVATRATSQHSKSVEIHEGFHDPNAPVACLEATCNYECRLLALAREA